MHANSRAAREFSSGWRKAIDADSRAAARACRARDRLSTRILHDSGKFRECWFILELQSSLYSDSV